METGHSCLGRMSAVGAQQNGGGNARLLVIVIQGEVEQDHYGLLVTNLEGGLLVQGLHHGVAGSQLKIESGANTANNDRSLSYRQGR